MALKCFRWTRNKTARLAATALLSPLALVGCIKSSKGKLDSFKADGGNAWEYLVDRTVNLQGDLGSGGVSMGSAMAGFGGMDQSLPGSSAALAGSLDSMGVCYWYTKIEKAGPLDGGYKLDLSDGTPNLGVRNNLIARAGVPLTANVVRMTDVLQAMHDAGGELKRMQAEISQSAVQLHKVLWEAAATGSAGVGAGAVGVAGLSSDVRGKVGSFAKPLTAGLSQRFNGASSAARATTEQNQIGKILRNAISFADGGAKGSVAVQTITTGRFGSLQLTQIAIAQNGKRYFRQSKPGAGNIHRVRWASLSKDAIEALGLTSDSPLLNAAELFKRENRTLRAAGMGAIDLGSKGFNAAKKTTGNVVRWCGDAGKSMHRAVCLGVVGTFAAGVHTLNKFGKVGSDQAKDAVVAQQIEAVLNDPNVSANFAAVMQQFQKQKDISSRLLEELRKQLIAKSATSSLGRCTDVFGTEILTTPGVAGTGYESQVGSISTDLSTPGPSLPEMAPTPSNSMSTMPSFADDGSLGTSAGSSDLGPLEDSSATVPTSMDPLPADAVDFSSDTSEPTFDSSLDGSATDGSSTGDATSF